MYELVNIRRVADEHAQAMALMVQTAMCMVVWIRMPFPLLLVKQGVPGG